jgi:hypothetical protein
MVLSVLILFLLVTTLVWQFQIDDNLERVQHDQLIIVHNETTLGDAIANCSCSEQTEWK